MLPANDPRVEVGNRHRRRTDRGLAVDLGVVALVDVGVIAAQPNAADRKSAVAPALRDPGLLQQQQRAAAGPEIDELPRLKEKRDGNHLCREQTLILNLA